MLCLEPGTVVVLKSCTNHTDYGLGRLREDAATLAHGWRGWAGTTKSEPRFIYNANPNGKRDKSQKEENVVL